MLDGKSQFEQLTEYFCRASEADLRGFPDNQTTYGGVQFLVTLLAFIS